MLSISLSRHGDTDMTSGNIARHLIIFAIPLLIGNIFQQLYNTVDSIIVGNYVGKEALAAVGCTAPIINTFINVFSGFASGAGVVISNYYGAKEGKNVHRSVQTAVAFTIILCVILTILGIFLTPGMLKLMDTPEDVFSEAAEYLKIYFMGLSGLLLYNIGAGILRAVGDSSRPLYFLIICAVMNTVLDIVFVKYVGWGIAGAAAATILSQFVSAFLVMLYLSRTSGNYKVELLKLRISGNILKTICRIGLPTAFQMGITAFSNIFVQGYVNRLGSSAMAGWSAYNKLDAFAMQPMLSLCVAVTTFIGQNKGAKETLRLKKCPRYSLAMSFAIFVATTVPLMVFAPQLTALFNNDPEVVEFGTRFIRLISPFYFFFAINQVYIGILRGSGDTIASMFILLFSFVVFRQIFLYIVTRVMPGFISTAMGYPSGWAMCSLLLILYYYLKGRKKLEVC